jgi:dUTP pyrophosphatase
MFHTGLKFIIPEGYHVKIFPRSSLHLYGYTLAKNVGIIDEGYRGEIMVLLQKYDPTCIEFELPFRGVQFILEKKVVYSIVQVDNESDTTSRSDNGFGSTGH